MHGPIRALGALEHKESNWDRQRKTHSRKTVGFYFGGGSGI